MAESRWLLHAGSEGSTFDEEIERDQFLTTAAQELVRRIPNPTRVLLSFMDDDPSFVIPSGFWEALEGRGSGIALSLYVPAGVPTGNCDPPPDAEKFIELESVEGPIAVRGTDLADSIEQWKTKLQQVSKSRRPMRIRLGRFSKNGQFNLYFDHQLVDLLAEVAGPFEG